jgi:hydrogenase maturation factor HypE
MSNLDKKLIENEIATGILTFNAKLILVEVNQQYLSMTGFIETDLLGNSIDYIEKLCAGQISAKVGDSVVGHFHSVLK